MTVRLASSHRISPFAAHDLRLANKPQARRARPRPNHYGKLS
jgi:hypothetical protein